MAKVQFIEIIELQKSQDHHMGGIVARDTEGRVWFHRVGGYQWEPWEAPEKPMDGLKELWPRNILPDAVAGLSFP